MAVKLPEGMKERELVPDSANRLGHWYHAKSDTTVNMGADWKPSERSVEISDSMGARASELSKMTKAPMLALATSLQIADADKMTKAQMTDAILAAEGFEVDTLTGRRVEIVTGRFEGKHGTVSEKGGADDSFAAKVVVDESGEELSFDDVETDLRFLTLEEIAADEAALKAKKDSASA